MISERVQSHFRELIASLETTLGGLEIQMLTDRYPAEGPVQLARKWVELEIP
jgi:hypothetical protein